MQLADAHLTYIGSLQIGKDYDVYGPGRAMQLGWVSKYGREWIAEACEAHVNVVAPTRWEAAIKLWPEEAIGV